MAKQSVTSTTSDMGHGVYNFMDYTVYLVVTIPLKKL